jgi:hypothetical protein
LKEGENGAAPEERKDWVGARKRAI